jgi:hypothetical protein
LQPRPQPRGSPTVATKTTTKKITNNCNQDHKYQDHNQDDQCSHKHNAKLRPPRLRLQPLGRSLATVTKKEEEEDDNQHEDCDQERHEQLQTQKM